MILIANALRKHCPFGLCIDQSNDTILVFNKPPIQLFPIHCTDDDSGLQYVDLLLNPERFTGYSGPSAHRIWNSIYQENCFKEEASSYKSLLQGDAAEPCLEKRVFYRVISGLHASINTHLSAEYLLKGKLDGL